MCRAFAGGAYCMNVSLLISKLKGFKYHLSFNALHCDVLTSDVNLLRSLSMSSDLVPVTDKAW